MEASVQDTMHSLMQLEEKLIRSYALIKELVCSLTEGLVSFATGQCSHGKLIYILTYHSLRLTPNLKILQLHDLCRFVDFWKDCLIEQLEGLSGYGLPALVPPKLQNWACFGCFLMLGHCSFPSFFVLCFEGSLLFGIQCIPSASG